MSLDKSILEKEFVDRVNAVNAILKEKLTANNIDYIIIASKNFHTGEEGTIYGVRHNISSGDAAQLLEYIRDRGIERQKKS